jgi:hypothetical protein
MFNSLRLGVGRYLLPIPALIWQRQIQQNARQARQSLIFMTTDHHRVRNFVVQELPNAGQPLAPELIAQRLDLPLTRVQAILDDLERRLTFLYRNDRGEVEWAYPVTAATTPHRFTLTSGEALYAA